MQIINVREHVEYQEKAIKYIQNKWANENTLNIYEDCIVHSLKTDNSLPMDLWPWICAFYIEDGYRGMSLGEKLLLKIKEDTKNAGFNKLYLCTNHIGYYEKYDFSYIGDGYHPWGSISRIYEASLIK
ncbi:GNAT family N-acetyltransferase [Priestia megaterium]|uniref:GNAT family N-acetyltransferase n=1 Tax=Priestia megaterium TaxID=1404 RepID=UPI003457E636